MKDVYLGHLAKVIMKINPITIFKFTSYKSEKRETEKTSYWLQKLFKQEKEKVIEQERILQYDAESGINSNSFYNQSADITSPVEQVQNTPEEKGVDDAVRGLAKKSETDRQTLEGMVNNSNRVISKVSSVFPWDFFPTTITLEDTRLTIIYRQLFSSQIYSVDLKDISNVLLERGILFATIIIISKTFVHNDIRIGTLWKEDGVLLRRLIEGLRMLEKEKIDTTQYTVVKLVEKLKELSTVEKNNFIMDL